MAKAASPTRSRRSNDLDPYFERIEPDEYEYIEDGKQVFQMRCFHDEALDLEHVQFSTPRRRVATFHGDVETLRELHTDLGEYLESVEE